MPTSETPASQAPINPLCLPEVQNELLAGRPVPERWRKSITDLSQLSGLSGLRKLDLHGTSVTDVSPLSDLIRLDVLKLSGTGVTDLSPLSDLIRLEVLDLSGTGVTDLSPLSGLIKLRLLYLGGTGVSDLSALSNLIELTFLSLRDTSVSDLTALSGLSGLQTLYLGETGVSDLTALSGLIKLRSLYLGGTGVSDLSALSGLFWLRMLDLHRTCVRDLKALSGLNALLSLDLSGTAVSDLTALSGLSGLQTLSLRETGVRDFTALSGLRGLRILDLSGTGIKDISALDHLRHLQIIGLDEVPSLPLRPSDPTPTTPSNEPPARKSATCEPAAPLPDRVKLLFDDARWLDAVLAVEDPGFSIAGSSRDMGFIAVKRPAGVSEDRFRSTLELLCAQNGGRILPEFRYDLEDQATFDPTFEGATADSTAGSVDETPATLDDVLRRIGAKGQHNHRDDNVILAVVDTGIDGSRLELQAPGKKAGGWAPPGEDPWEDWLGHGTMCACIAAGSGARNGRFVGVAPHANLVSCRSTFVDGDLVLIYEQLIRLARSGKTVIATNSFGTRTGTPPALDPMTFFPRALDKAIEAGVHVVFSAGNYHLDAGGTAESCAPNSIWLHKGRSDVLTVGTCDLDGRMWDYSSRGPHQPNGAADLSDKPDVVAPTPRNGLIAYGAGDIVAPNGWGTSGAAPQVAGLLALLLSERRDLPRRELYDIVRDTAKTLGHGRRCEGHGIIDCSAAMERLLTMAIPGLV